MMTDAPVPLRKRPPAPNASDPPRPEPSLPRSSSLFPWKRAFRSRVVAPALASVALLVAGFTPWPVARLRVQEALASAFHNSGGTALQIAGRTAFVLLPTPRLIARDVIAAHENGARLRAGEVLVSLDPGALFRGALASHDLLLSEAEITVALPAGTAQASAWLKTLVSNGGPEPFLLETVGFRNTVLRVTAPDRAAHLIEHVSGSWGGKAGDKAFGLALRGLWRGETVELTIEGPLRGAGPEPAPLSVRLTSRPIDASFSGTLRPGPEPRISGRVTASSVDGVDFARWLGVATPLPGRLDSASVQGVLDAGLRDGAISEAVVTLNGDRYEGVVGVRSDEARPLLSATLAAARVDLTDQLGFMLPRRAPDDGWSREPFALSRPPPYDLDIRISAGALAFNRMELERAALSILLRGSRFEVALAEASLGQGSLKGRLLLQQGPGGVELKSSLTADGFDPGAILLQATGARRISGTAALTLNLDSNGRSTLQLAQNATGKINLAIRDGALLGLDLDRFLLRLERRSLIAALEVPGGQTPFSTGSLVGTISNGKLEANEGAFTSPSLFIRFSGQSDAPNRLIDLAGSVSSGDGAGPAATIVPFTVRGSWSAPRISADPDGIRKKS